MSEFYEDLLKAQQEIEKVDKDAVNPFFKSDYTTLNATIQACKSALNKNNIIVLQPIESDENGVYVSTTLIHTSGESLTSKMTIREAKNNDPQAQGSAITYARRYSLKSMLCMSDEDDDGEKAQTTYRKPVKKDDPRFKDNKTYQKAINTDYATDAQMNAINKLIKSGKLHESVAKNMASMTKQEASDLIGSVYGDK